MSKSKIEWTDRVWNPVTGCSKVSPGCDNCYAERMSRRFGEKWGLPADDPFKVTLHPDRLEQPLNWRKPSKIFVCSMADLFHDDVPDEFIMQVFNTMAHAQWFFGHKFFVLTKRPERMKRIIDVIKADIEEQRIPIKNTDGTTTHKMTFAFPLQNIWLGITAENQEQADKRIPILLQIPAAVRFVSIEPMLGPIDLTDIHYDNVTAIDALNGLHGLPKPHADGPKLNWIICGGESGPGARPMHPDWARSLRDQCQAANIPFFFKQWGEWLPSTQAGANVEDWNRSPKRYQEGGSPADAFAPLAGKYIEYWGRVGKKSAGSLLDGQEWKQIPGVAP